MHEYLRRADFGAQLHPTLEAPASSLGQAYLVPTVELRRLAPMPEAALSLVGKDGQVTGAAVCSMIESSMGAHQLGPWPSVALLVNASFSLARCALAQLLPLRCCALGPTREVRCGDRRVKGHRARHSQEISQ